MTDLSSQKRLAADELGVGESRVWLDPDQQADIAEAITREDIRELIEEDTIQADPESSNSRGRARERQSKRSYGHQKGPGTRKGTAGARENEKKDWQSRIRAHCGSSAIPVNSPGASTASSTTRPAAESSTAWRISSDRSTNEVTYDGNRTTVHSADATASRGPNGLPPAVAPAEIRETTARGAHEQHPGQGAAGRD